MRRPLPPLAAVLSFIDCINHTDLDDLLALMTDDHVLSVLNEQPVSGKAALRPAWRAYFEAFPNYVVYPQRFAQRGDFVAVLGYTSGSHLGCRTRRKHASRCSGLQKSTTA